MKNLSTFSSTLIYHPRKLHILKCKVSILTKFFLSPTRKKYWHHIWYQIKVPSVIINWVIIYLYLEKYGIHFQFESTKLNFKSRFCDIDYDWSTVKSLIILWLSGSKKTDKNKKFVTIQYGIHDNVKLTAWLLSHYGQ